MHFSVKTRLLRTLAFCPMFIASAAMAESVALTFEVTSKSEGQVDFVVVAENISLAPLHDVTLQTSDGFNATLEYGDINPGQKISRPTSLYWQPDQEPPSVSWLVEYVDEQGELQTETH